jgi:hypothetical protein
MKPSRLLMLAALAMLPQFAVAEPPTCWFVLQVNLPGEVYPFNLYSITGKSRQGALAQAEVLREDQSMGAHAVPKVALLHLMDAGVVAEEPRLACPLIKPI